MPVVDAAVQQLKSLLRIGPKEAAIISRTREKRIERTDAVDLAADSAVSHMCFIFSLFLQLEWPGP
jgi:hypothetical protein